MSDWSPPGSRTPGGSLPMKASVVQREIGERLSADALAWWNGAGQELIDEMVILGQRSGVHAALKEIEELSKPAVE